MNASTLAGALVGVSLTAMFTGIASGGTNDIRVLVTSVMDMRSTSDSMPRCQVQLKFSGDAVSDALGIREIRITAAVDDTGRDLRASPDRMRLGSRFSGGPARQLAQMAELANPSRNAHAIKTLEGEADLLFPTAENSGLVIAKDFMAKPGEPLGDPALKKANVTITYLGKDGSESRSDDVAGEIPVQVPPRRRPSAGPSLRFSIDDPDRRLVEMTFMDNYGRQVWAGQSGINGTIRSYTFQDDLPTNVRLFVYLATPDAIKTIPFKIENIALP